MTKSHTQTTQITKNMHALYKRKMIDDARISSFTPVRSDINVAQKKGVLKQSTRIINKIPYFLAYFSHIINQSYLKC